MKKRNIYDSIRMMPVTLTSRVRRCSEVYVFVSYHNPTAVVLGVLLSSSLLRHAIFSSTSCHLLYYSMVNLGPRPNNFRRDRTPLSLPESEDYCSVQNVCVLR